HRGLHGAHLPHSRIFAVRRTCRRRGTEPTTMTTTSGAASVDTRPFAPFEWLLARRYLRARRKEGFISVIAGFSFIGIMLGAATLIIVMAVMNGFRSELVQKILGVNGHVIAYRVADPFTDYAETAARLSKVGGVRAVLPLVEGQAMISSSSVSLGGLIRGVSEGALRQMPLVADNIRFGSLEGFDDSESLAIGIRLANMLRVTAGDAITLVSPRGAA